MGVFSVMNSPKKKIVLIGGGGHCRSVIDALKACNDYSDIVITDSDILKGSIIQECIVAGTDDVLPVLYNHGFEDAFIAVGGIKDTSVRRRCYDIAKTIGFSLSVIIDPSSAIARDVQISKGVYVGKNATINSGSKIGCCAIINTGAIIEHECIIGEFSHISVGAVVCGNCNIGSDVFIGANATVIQGVHIGDNSIIGAGTVVLADVPSDITVTGVWDGIEDR